MLQKYFKAAIAAAFVVTLFSETSCTKLDTTSQGVDLLLVDNINTFADTLTVNATQGIFANDSSIIKKTDNYVMGKVTNDVYFGNTDAAIYVQFKPPFYPFYFGNPGDSVRRGSPAPGTSMSSGFDTAFLCLSYRGAWGDTTTATNIPQTFNVYTVNDPTFYSATDSIFKFFYQPTLGSLVGSATITPSIIANYARLNKGLTKDSVNNQIRIKLDNTFASSIFNGQDSISTGINNAFYNDSTFRNKFNGFAVTVSGGGNTLYYINLSDAKTRLEFHYNKVSSTGVKDTVVQSFIANTAASGSTYASSSSSNYIKRNYAGSPAAINVGNSSPNYIYLQTSPGTYADLKIPALTGYSNRIVHRAYLIVEQAPSTTSADDKFTPPPFLYADLKENPSVAVNRFKPIYFDLSSILYYPDNTDSLTYFPRTNIDHNNFGGGALARSEDITGLTFYRYEINITRYVQHIVTNNYFNYDLRLYAPFYMYYPQYGGIQKTNSIPFQNAVAQGRVRVGSGSNANHKMRLVVIYSKL